jgi:N utilization substance protein B
MAARTKARKRALDIVFESEARDLMLNDLLNERVVANDPPINEYTVLLVRGLAEHINEVDGLLETYAEGWTLDRMPAVDRNVLRLATFEILYVDDVPDAVAISEALGLVGDLSTDESPSFVNGVLGNVVRNKPAQTA